MSTDVHGDGPVDEETLDLDQSDNLELRYCFRGEPSQISEYVEAAFSDTSPT